MQPLPTATATATTTAKPTATVMATTNAKPTATATAIAVAIANGHINRHGHGYSHDHRQAHCHSHAATGTATATGHGHGTATGTALATATGTSHSYSHNYSHRHGHGHSHDHMHQLARMDKHQMCGWIVLTVLLFLAIPVFRVPVEGCAQQTDRTGTAAAAAAVSSLLLLLLLFVLFFLLLPLPLPLPLLPPPPPGRRGNDDGGPILGVEPGRPGSRRRDRHFADTSFSIPIETPAEGRGGCSRMTELSPAAAGQGLLIPALKFSKFLTVRPPQPDCGVGKGFLPAACTVLSFPTPQSCCGGLRRTARSSLDLDSPPSTAVSLFVPHRRSLNTQRGLGCLSRPLRRVF